MSKRDWIAVVLAGLIFAALRSYSQPQSGMPAAVQLTHAPQDHDYPAIAQTGDTVYVAYVQFAHADPALEKRTRFDSPPQNFDFLSRPAAGDQVFLLTYAKAARTWSEPLAVSAPRQDVLRTAVAVDGKGRVWVFWAANVAGNFGIYARAMLTGKWGREIRLTTDSGTDLNPVAATDSHGRVWVAWQAFRNRNLEILAAAQRGDGFTKETVVSFSRKSDWDPAIASAPNGEVAISWDTYDKGDYDVYFRRLKMDSAIRMEPSYCNLWVTSPTREGIMEAFRKRRVYGSTDNILADIRCGGHLMGEEFSTSEPPVVSVKLWGTDKFAKVHIVKDGEYVYSAVPDTKVVDFAWKDGAAQKGKTSYYYVRGEQADGELIWGSPMWITYK